LVRGRVEVRVKSRWRVCRGYVGGRVRMTEVAVDVRHEQQLRKAGNDARDGRPLERHLG